MKKETGGEIVENVQKVSFLDPETNELVEFVVEEETQVNGIKYLMVSEDTEDGTWNAYILKEMRNENDEILYEVVEDEVEFTALAKVFTELSDEETEIEY